MMKVKSVLKEWKVSIVFSILFAALVLTFPVQATAADGNGISEKNYSNFERLLQIAKSEGKVKVIVKLKVPKIKELTTESNRFCTVEPGLKSSWSGANADMALMDAVTFAAYNVQTSISGSQFRVNHIYASIPYMALEVSAEALAILQGLPEVLDIKEDIPMKLIDPVRGSSGAKGKANVSSHSDLSHPMLDNTVSVIGADTAWAMGYTGSGWYVAVLDTGIRQTHQFFQGKTIIEACFAQGETGLGDCPNGDITMTGPGSADHHPDTYNGYDHGTHVAGIAAGNNGSLFGVAKDANIIAVQVFSRFPGTEPSCDGTPCVLCWDSDTLAGLDYIYSIRGSCSIASVNMSLGGGDYTSACDSDPRKAIIDNLRAVGIVTVIATGNDGNCGSVNSPACISSSVSVGSSTDDDYESSFNNWHATMQKLFAPGTLVYSSTGSSDSSYESWDGTSMATPHVAGAWALLKQAKSTATVSEILTALQSTGVPITSVCDGNTTPIPRIQVDTAINVLVPPTVTVTSPNGGESWEIGSTHNITWTTSGTVGDVKIEFSTNNGSSWSIINSSTANDGEYSWTVPNVSSTQCLVRISEASDDSPSDISEDVFTIYSTPLTLTVTSPNGGENWEIGSTHNITWTTTGTVGDVKIEFSTNNGSSWSIINSSTANDGEYSWTVPNVSSTQCLVRISEASDGSPSDISDNVFSIFSPTLTVTSPNGGESWEIGSTHNITWTTSGTVEDVKIEFSTNNDSSWSIITSSTANDGEYSWTVPNVSSTQCLVRISEASDGSPSDISDNVFAIYSQPLTLTVTKPNGGERWEAGSTRRIKWTSTGSVGNVKIEFSTNNGSSWSIINSSTANNNEYIWKVPNVSSTQCLVRISEASDGNPSDISDNVFSIFSPTLTVISPNGGESWEIGSTQDITWTTTGTVRDVKIEFSANNGSSWSTVTSSTANDGEYSWTVPNLSSTQCLIRISEASDGSPSDISDNVFSIFSPTLTVISPNGGESWEIGSTQDITWTTTGTVGDVKIEFSANNGSSWSTIASSTSNKGVYSWKVPDLESSACRVRISEVSDGSPSDTSDAVFSIFDPIPPEIALSRTKLNFGALNPGSLTGSQVLWLNNSGGGTLNWSTDADVSWLNCTPGSGANAGVLTVSVNPAGLTGGSYTGAITITDPNASNSPQTVTVNLTVKSASEDQPPFGTFSTPTTGSVVCSSIPVTGWILDDIEVTSVKIYVGSAYVGDAVFVEDARPDVEQAYPGYPKNHQAGWGYMLLTNYLPEGGNGTYTLYAKATDSEGNQVTLGSKTITCDNATAVKPFGAIDTPAQGGSTSGSSYVNWGWVLTPQPNSIPTDGSTINVFVDGVNLGHPTYNIYRSDIDTLFPDYANSSGATGYFYLDTTNYMNGMHTIQWTATDTGGNTDGIGSRYFSIGNAGTSAPNKQSCQEKTGLQTTIHNISQIAHILVDYSVPIRVKRGFNEDIEPQFVPTDDKGVSIIKIKEVERIQIHLTDRFYGDITDKSLSSNSFSGYLLVNQQLKRLPVGSFLDTRRGIFYWQPGPGFLGCYHLVFVETSPGGTMMKKNIIVEIVPKTVVADANGK